MICGVSKFVEKSADLFRCEPSNFTSEPTNFERIHQNLLIFSHAWIIRLGLDEIRNNPQSVGNVFF